MQIGIYGYGTFENASKIIKKILTDSGIDSFNITKFKKKHGAMEVNLKKCLEIFFEVKKGETKILYSSFNGEGKFL